MKTQRAIDPGLILPPRTTRTVPWRSTEPPRTREAAVAKLVLHRLQQPPDEPERDEGEQDREHPRAGRPLAQVEELEPLLVEVVRRRVGLGPGPAPRQRVDDVEQLRRVDEA